MTLVREGKEEEAGEKDVSKGGKEEEEEKDVSKGRERRRSRGKGR